MRANRSLKRLDRRRPDQHQSGQRSGSGRRQSFRPGLEALEARMVLSTLTVLNNNDSGPGSLRAEIAAAASGDRIVFAPSLAHQTITLTTGELAVTRSLDIEGLGASDLTISGNAASRVFHIGGGVTATLAGLTITAGRADHGAGILNEAGANLIVSHVTLSGNQTAGGLGGGAIFNGAGAILSVRDSSLTSNRATTAVNFDPSTGGGGGGAIFNETGALLNVMRSELIGNQAITTAGFDNFGGAIYNLGGTATIRSCTLSDNQVSGGGSGTDVGGSVGGAVENSIGATLTLDDSDFTGNRAISAAGDGYFAEGGALDNEFRSAATISDSHFASNRAVVGTSGQVANEADGGAVENTFDSTLTVTETAFVGNSAVGGEGGGKGEGGAIQNVNGATATVTLSTFIGNQAIGGDHFRGSLELSFNPGIAIGGGIQSGPFGAVLTVDQCTFTGNQAIAGNGGTVSAKSPIGDGLDEASGGGLENESTLTLSRSTFSHNLALGGSNTTDTRGPFTVIGDAEGGGLANYTFRASHPLDSVAKVTDCRFDHNQAIGGSGNRGVGGDILTGAGEGGGIANYGVLTASNLSLCDNQAVGGSGNRGGAFAGDGISGGLMNSFVGLRNEVVMATISDSTITHNQAVGAQAVAGANSTDGLGGGIANLLGASLTVNDCALDSNQAVGGAGNDRSRGGNGLGGGIYNDGNTAFGVTSLTVTASNITDNLAEGGEGDDGGSDGQGIGGGVYLVMGGEARKDKRTVIAHNHASTTSDNVFGTWRLI